MLTGILNGSVRSPPHSCVDPRNPCEVPPSLLGCHTLINTGLDARLASRIVLAPILRGGLRVHFGNRAAHAVRPDHEKGIRNGSC